MKNNNLKTIITIVCLLLYFGMFSQGSRGGQGGRKSQNRGQQNTNKPDASEILLKLDINKDGVIDKDEASQDERGKISEDFDNIDFNDDGLIDFEELKEALNDSKRTKQVSPEKLINQIDDNQDGTLNELEVAVKDHRELIDNFNKIDTSEDGELDLEELKVFFNKNDRPKRKKRG